MKTLAVIVPVVLLATVLVNAQQPLISRPHNVDPNLRQQAAAASQAQLPQQSQQMGFQPLFQQSNVPPAPVAEVVTPDIQALANGLQNNPVQIFNFVHDHIRHVLYFGSKKGAEITLLEKSGNEFDQCALLVALLRAAGYTNAVGTDHGVGYQFGWMLMPYDNPDGSDRDLHHWLQLTLNNTNWTNTSNYLYQLIYNYRGYPGTAAIWDTNTFAFQRIWVELTIGSSTYYLDPAFKVSEPVAGISLPSAMGFSSNALITAISALPINESAVTGTLAGYTTNLLNYIHSNAPNASVQQIVGGWTTVPSTNTTLSANLPFQTTNLNGAMPVLTWQYQPTNMMSTLQIRLVGTNYQWFVPQLEGQRISLTFDQWGNVALWQDDLALLAGFANGGSGSYTNVSLYIHHPVGTWDTNGNNFISSTVYDEASTNAYLRSNSTYNIIYGFEPDVGWLQKRQNMLDFYLLWWPDENPNSLVDETMNVMGLNYRTEFQNLVQLEAAQSQILPQFYHHIGRMGQEANGGYYFDLFMMESGDMPSGGYNTASMTGLTNFLNQSCYVLPQLKMDFSAIWVSTNPDGKT